VLKAAEELDFAPNLVARGVVAQRTYLVGLLVRDLVDERTAALARGVQDVASANGFAVLVLSTDGDTRRELDAVRQLRSMRVDAIIFSYSIVDDRRHIAELTAQLKHVETTGGVLVRLAPHPQVNPDASVSTRHGLGLAVDHLVSLGHHRIALVRGPASTGLSRVAKYAMHQVLERHDLKLTIRSDIESDGTFEGGRSAAARLVGGRAPCTAVVTVNDQLAIGLLKGFAELGARVPQDISVVGFDDVPSASFTTPGLTTVHVPLQALGGTGMQIAIWLLGGGARMGRKNLALELTIRQSTAPPPPVGARQSK
jgi:LacI family transcriptional regulator